MKGIIGNIKPLENSLNIPEGNILKVRGLVKECTLCDAGECLLFGCKCLIQQNDITISCSYFSDAILPLDPVLNQKVLEYNKLEKSVTKYNKTCKDCGSKFKTAVKNDTRCPKCKRKADLEKKRAYKKRQG